MKEKTPRVDWAELLRKTFDFVRAILEHLGLPTAGARLAPARGPLQAAGC